ncbi:hypothetical protein BDV30DRAFT_245075 [Aspergillus minisclerotigenes]|uniref:Uncharacterized protein n=1 Tax=Aspergillus minisclerotigenes TaxID=656917 RepID=A0A5N6IL71_9EURO|nr:hypothetical protein BDV30DRAFT_245075 [Aspergillus minisclerotigenes]
MSQPPPQLSPSHLCSVTVTLGPSLPPIPLLGGGTRILQPITGGSIQGAGFNGTIDGGLSAPIHLDARSESGETQITKLPWIYVYGHADDGSPFFIEEAGIGSVGKQNTRVVIQVGGVYARLQEAFLVGQPGREPGGEGARVESIFTALLASVRVRGHDGDRRRSSPAMQNQYSGVASAYHP